MGRVLYASRGDFWFVEGDEGTVLYLLNADVLGENVIQHRRDCPLGCWAPIFPEFALKIVGAGRPLVIEPQDGHLDFLLGEWNFEGTGFPDPWVEGSHALLSEEFLVEVG